MSVYVHERIDIDGGGRGRYLDLVRGSWAEHAAERFHIRLAGVWATVGSSANWPEAQVLWEMRDWEHFGHARQSQYPLEDKDAFGSELWRQALAYRKHGHASLLVPAFAQPEDRPTGQVFLFEDVRTRPGGMEAYHEALEREGVSSAKDRGVELFGAYRHVLRPNVAVNIWAMSSFDAWGKLMEKGDIHAPSWLEVCNELLDDLDGYLLASVPDAQLGT